MNKSLPKRKHGVTLEYMGNKFRGNLSTGALNGGMLPLFFNENKKESLDCLKP